jgi:hypothetical protein
MKFFQYPINGDDWTIGLLSNDDMAAEHGDDAAGITIAEEKKMDFCVDHITDSVVMHELVHAHASYMFFDDASPTTAMMEEIFCQFFGERHKLLVKQKNAIKKQLKALEKEAIAEEKAAADEED